MSPPKTMKTTCIAFKGEGGRGVGDSKGGAPRESLDRTKGAPWHDLGRA